MISCKHVVDMLTAYHHREYPDDGNWEDWYISFASVMDRDEYILLIKYRQPPGKGDLFAKRTFGGLELHFYESVDGSALMRRLRDDFDEMRMEIIETLDGLVVRKKPKVSYFQEYPDPKDPYDWKQMYKPIKIHGLEYLKGTA